MSARSALDSFMRMSGEMFEIAREGSAHQAKGLRNADKTGRKFIGFYPGTDVQSGDWLKGMVSEDEFYVMDIARPLINGQVLQVKAYYETKAEYDRRTMAERREGTTITVESAIGSIIGTQQVASLRGEFDLRQIKAEISQRGGADAEALAEMVAELLEVVRQQNCIRKGGLARFAEVLERNSWITGAIAETLLAWAIGKL